MKSVGLSVLFTLFTFNLGQEYVYKCLGVDVLENAFNGYNACIFAYGQTGAVVSSLSRYT